MEIGNKINQLRKLSGMTQEQLAEKLNVSRQTISKWETNETTPDIYQAKKMALLYNISLDDLVAFDMEFNEIQNAIANRSEELEEKIDWTNVWGKIPDSP